MTSSRRRRPSGALLVALLALVVAVAATPAGGAMAGALNVKTVKEIAKKTADKEIKKKAGTLTVARAHSSDDAGALGGVPAGSFQRKGTATFTLSAVGWSSVSPSPLSYTHWSDGTTITSPVNAGHVFTYPVTVPVVLGGAPVTLSSLRYCYAASAGVHLTGESVQQLAFTNGMGISSAPVIQNDVDLADTGCRTIQVNRVLGPNDQVNLFASGTWTVPNAQFRLGAVQVTVTQG
jgi:hypothetical protein